MHGAYLFFVHELRYNYRITQNGNWKWGWHIFGPLLGSSPIFGLQLWQLEKLTWDDDSHRRAFFHGAQTLTIPVPSFGYHSYQDPDEAGRWLPP